MDQDYHNKKWGVNDFERYHSGKMPDAEMHALERAALDDPFLEDALEGYAYTKTAVSDIDELRKKIVTTKKETKVVWYKQKGTTQLLKVAAILIIFLGFAWLLNDNRKNKKDEIASVTKTPTTANKITTDSVAPAPSEISVAPDQFSTATDQLSKVEKIKNEPGASFKQQKPEQAKTEEVVSLASVNPAPDSQYAKTDMAAVENIKLSSREKSAAAPSVVSQALEGKVSGVVIRSQNSIKGRVVDDAGNPVAFANITDRENNLILAADKDGYFSLSNRQNTPVVKVDVNAIGFETNNVALNADNKENKIVLKESNQALNEVVVSGYGSRKKSTVASAPQKFERDLSGISNNKITLVNALPLNGWESFYRFMNDSLYNKKLPASVYQEVVLEFNIDSAGKAQNIVVKKSVSDSLDTAAKQIMQSIPAIRKIKKGKKAEAIIRL